MPKYNEIRVKVNSSNRNFAPDSAKTVSSESIIVKCSLNDFLSSFVQSINSRKRIIVNIYVQTIGNVTNSTLNGVNTFSNF